MGRCLPYLSVLEWLSLIFAAELRASSMGSRTTCNGPDLFWSYSGQTSDACCSMGSSWFSLGLTVYASGLTEASLMAKHLQLDSDYPQFSFLHAALECCYA